MIVLAVASSVTGFSYVNDITPMSHRTLASQVIGQCDRTNSAVGSI
jgi:hypothetical protein